MALPCHTRSGCWYGRGQTCALVVDSNAAAFSGSESATAGAANGLYTMSAYLASGTTGVTTTKARLSVVTTGGTGGTDCDITLTSTPTRYRCTASVAGATAVKGRVLVGNAAADTGSIQVCHSQFELSGFPTEPTLNGTAVSESTAYLPAAELSTWPYGSSSRGAVEVVFTPGYNFGAQNSGWPTTTSIFASGSEVFDNNDTFYLLDAVDSAPNHEVIMWWPGNQTKAFARLQASDGGINEVSTSGTTTLSKTTQYVERISWTASGGLCTLSLFLDTCADHATCRATTLIAGPGAAGTCPDVAYNQAHFMRRYSSSFPTNAFLKAVRVYQ